jgi:hypothetical protein
MLVRYRWYLIRGDQTFESSEHSLTQRVFDASAHAGFRRLQRQSDGSAWRFLWRTQVPTVAYDEEGQSRVEMVRTVEVQDFRLFTRGKTLFIRVDNPGRAQRALFNELHEALEYDVAFDLLPVTESDRPKYFSRFDSIRLVGVKLINVGFGEQVAGRIELASKTEINLSDIEELADKKFTVDTATYEISAELLRGQLVLSRNGSASISEKLAEFVGAYIESAFSEKPKNRQ